MASRRGVLPPAHVLQTHSGRLGYMVSGQGPGILLFSGAGVSMAGWRPLYPQIQRLGTVFGWNRCGIQDSDAPRVQQTGAVVLGSLRELLAHTRVQPPYVLVAHSLGGLYANLFARRWPQDVAGVLFLEATHPDDREVLKKNEGQLVRALGAALAEQLQAQHWIERKKHSRVVRVTAAGEEGLGTMGLKGFAGSA
ncbi:MAG: alpha/beta fold hydrolase [Comamonadaceae bacterium]|nr:MAG: alpha/beta fold hydrolase [Comamonadaceae bacterium]